MLRCAMLSRDMVTSVVITITVMNIRNMDTITPPYPAMLLATLLRMFCSLSITDSNRDVELVFSLGVTTMRFIYCSFLGLYLSPIL